jgi:hypothetical protein
MHTRFQVLLSITMMYAQEMLPAYDKAVLGPAPMPGNGIYYKSGHRRAG